MTPTFDIKANNTQKPVNIVRDWLYDVILHKAGTQNYVCIFFFQYGTDSMLSNIVPHDITCIYGNTSGCLCGWLDISL